MSKFLISRTLCLSSLFIAGVSLIAAENPKPTLTAPSLQNSVKQLDHISETFNTSPKSKARVDTLIKSYESLMGRVLSVEEKKFLSAELINVSSMPRFEIKNKFLQVYGDTDKTKTPVIKIEIVDQNKRLFKFQNKTFALNASDSFLKNVQMLLQGLEKEEVAKEEAAKAATPAKPVPVKK